MAKHSKGSEMFLTDRYKRFLNSNGLLYAFVEELFWAILGLIGILPTNMLTWFFSRSFSKLIATPIWQIFASINNLFEERKQAKSTVMLIALCLSMMLGGLLGYYVLYQSPLFMGAVMTFLNEVSCPPAISFVGAMLGGGLATLSNKIPPVLGVALGTFIGSYIPLTIPLIVDVVFVSALSTSVVAAFITKRILRIYYQHYYGHANADGYKIDFIEKDKVDFISSQAKKFEVEPAKFEVLINYCRNRIKQIKKNETSFFEEYWDIRRTKTNTYKDIYHKLMDPSIETDEEIALAKELLRLSSNKQIKKDTAELSSMTQKEIKYLPSIFASVHLNKTGKEVRVLTHQLFLDKGIDDDLIEPFFKPKVHQPSPE